MTDEFLETERQLKQLKDSIKYLEETKSNSICLRPEGVQNPSHFVWVDERNLSEIDLQPLIDRIKIMTIAHLKLEKSKLKKSYLKKFTNKLFMRAAKVVQS